MTAFVPKESKDYPGFYEIPGYDDYVISPRAELVNTRTSSCLKYWKDASGYIHYNPYIRDFKKFHSVFRSRLVGLAFKYPGPDYKHLEINHIDGNKENDSPDNIEWVTRKGNMAHASRTGLHPLPKPVSMRNVDTGEITKFPTAISCARCIGVNRDAMDLRLAAGEQRVFPERRQYRLGHSDEPWVIPEDIEYQVFKFGNEKSVLVRYILTGEVLEFPTLLDLANHLGIAISTASVWVNSENQPVFKNFIQVKWKHDPTPWREVSDPYMEYANQGSNRRCVKVVNTISDEVYIYQSAIECAKARGISPTCLDFRLKTQGKTVFSDKCRYGYYPY